MLTNLSGFPKKCFHTLGKLKQRKQTFNDDNTKCEKIYREGNLKQFKSLSFNSTRQ